MPELYDFNWSVTEQKHEQYNSFDLIGGKGVINWYPTIGLKFPEEFYSREEALLNATVAASAPHMLRLLEKLADYMEHPAKEDATIRSWREKVLKEISEAKGEVPRT